MLSWYVWVHTEREAGAVGLRSGKRRELEGRLRWGQNVHGLPGVVHGRAMMPAGMTGACGVGAGDSWKQSPGVQNRRLEASSVARGRGPGLGSCWGPRCVWTTAVRGSWLHQMARAHMRTWGQGQLPGPPPPSPVCPCSSCRPEPQFPQLYNGATVTYQLCLLTRSVGMSPELREGAF